MKLASGPGPLLAACLLAVLVALAGCTSSTPHIDLKDNEFVGGTASAPVGGELEFENEGSNTHNVQIMKVGATTELLNKDVTHGQSVEYKFTEAGTYDVWCKYHGARGTGMHMQVTVA